MISCPKCNNTFSFSSRLKSVNKSVIECNKCKTRYEMKYSRLLISINIFLICMISPRLKLLWPNTTFLVSMIRGLAIVIVWSFIVFFILSFFMKYKEIE